MIYSCGLIPLNIYNHIFPAKIFQFIGHIFRIAADICFGNSCSVTVPTVPTHRGIFSQHMYSSSDLGTVLLVLFLSVFCFYESGAVKRTVPNSIPKNGP